MTACSFPAGITSVVRCRVCAGPTAAERCINARCRLSGRDQAGLRWQILALLCGLLSTLVVALWPAATEPAAMVWARGADGCRYVAATTATAPCREPGR